MSYRTAWARSNDSPSAACTLLLQRCSEGRCCRTSRPPPRGCGEENQSVGGAHSRGVGRVESRASDLHELADGKQVGHRDVVAAEERLPAQEHGLQLVQRVVQLRQTATQTRLVHLGASLPRNQHLRQTHTQAEFPFWFFSKQK